MISFRQQRLRYILVVLMVITLPVLCFPFLPADVSEAFEAYKLAILRHKLAGWREISRDDLLSRLEALKQLARA